MRVIAFDIGSCRIGVAVSDPGGIIATPLGVWDRIAGVQAQARELAQLAAQEGAERIVVGMPLSLRGEHEQAAQEMQRIVEALRGATDLDVVCWDERMTTAIAERAMIQDGMKRRQRRNKIDGVAAAVILQSYLDAGSPSTENETKDTR